jgi:23S rRNA A1618 N6-methylase RlmF
MLFYSSFAKIKMFVSRIQSHRIPEDYICITVPNKEEFRHLLSDCRLENNGDKIHIHIPKNNFDALVELLHILVENDYIS